MNSSRKAFTLIELLVVIAIIAILAAILFPVFAQARAAARGASSQSNLKQMSLGVIMYVQDYDETFPLFQGWGTGPVTFGGVPFDMWSSKTQPYIKNAQIFGDPMASPVTQTTNATIYPFYTQYGYNYCALAPVFGDTTPWRSRPTAMAGVARSADLVMIGSTKTVTELGGIFWYGPGTITTLGGLEPPDCDTIVPWCFAGWGTGGNYSSLTEEAGKYTGGDSLRKSGNNNVAMTDGHAKFMQPGQLAIGTNWSKTISTGSIVVKDPTVYKWAASP